MSDADRQAIWDAGRYWIAYHTDWSGFRVFREELECLRYAVENSMAVKSVIYGEDPRGDRF